MSYQTHPRTPSYSTLEYQIKLYGHEEGHRRYTEICKKKKEGSQTSLIYWLNLGYSQEEAIELRKQRQQTFSLQKCITMYGEDLGKQKFKERQIKWQNTLQSKTEEEKRVINIKKNSFSVEGWMLKGYTQEEATNIINKKLYNCHIPRYSQEALIFFETNFDPTG